MKDELINVLQKKEYDKVIYDFHPNKHVPHKEIDIVTWFEKIAKKNKGKIAVSIGGSSINYKQLDEKANHVAKVLTESGVEKEDLIGIIMERSIEQIIAILGILKSGAAFLPIDPDNPEDRISYIIQDSNVKQVITDVLLKEKYKKSVNKKMICPDFSMKSNQKVTQSYSPNQLAYVIYTSGTTGNPKGVMIEHKGLVNFIKWHISISQFDENSVVLQKATCSFDAAVGEIFLGLLGGVKLQLLTGQENNDFSLLLDIISENKVTHMVMIPTVLSVFLDYASEVGKKDYLSSLKMLYIAGEKLEKSLVRKICNLITLEKENIYNLYGPTEASIGATYFQLTDLENQSNVSIGKAIDNAMIYIMNENKLCGVNEAGELCIGGIGVARGYLNRPDLTKEKFVDNYFGMPGKIYRTGDLAKWQENGNLEYLGRIDEQVKINGLRIELSEIKNILADYPKIDDAAVVVSENNRLIAYFVSKEHYQETELKEYLEKKLPLYMVPKRFIYIEVLPVNKNGKLDKNKLPAIEEELTMVSNAGIQPKTEKERVLISAFSSVLNNNNIYCDHNFFEVGGDSIKAIRIVSRLRELGYELSVPTIMAEKNISSIATHIKTIQDEIMEPMIVGKTPLSPIQKYFFDSKLPEPFHFNQTFLLECKELSVVDFETALAAVCNHHDLLRAVYKNAEQIIKEPSENKIFELLTFDLTDSDQSLIFGVMETISDKIQPTLNLEDGPLIKAVIFKTDQKDYISLIVHHLMVDGISWRILVEDINTAYRQSVENTAIQLPPKTASFSRWCQTLEEFSQSEMLEREHSYWESITKLVSLSDAVLCTSENQQGTGYDEIALSEELTKNLIFNSNQSYNTEINDLLVTALFRTINKLTSANTIAIQMEGHGREPIHAPIHIDRTIGWFTTIYPVVSTESGGEIQEDIKKVKENLRRIPNHGLGYSVLNCYDETFDSVQTEITFNYLGDFEKEASDYDIQINTVEYGAQISENNHFGTAISIDGSLNNGIISFVFIYDKSRCSETLIKELKAVFEQELTAVVNHCLTKVGTEKTASDYGEITWDEEEFRKVESSFLARNTDIEKIYPLTPLQEGLLFHEQKEMMSNAYIVQSIYELGLIDVPVFKRALDLLVQKHSALRTNMIYKDVRIPRQVIRQHAVCDCEVIDLSECNEQVQELTMLEQKNIQDGFDLENDSLFRIKLVKMSKDSIKMMMTFHHIIMDGWCNAILLTDIKSFYDRLLTGETDGNIMKEFKPDYAHAEHVQYLENTGTRTSKEYWQTLLKDYTTIANILPTAVTTAEAEENKVNQMIDSKVTQQIRTLAKMLNVTVNTIFESAWGILLQHYTNTEDVVFGQVVSGRNSPINNIEEKVGLFINTIPVRVEKLQDENFATIASNLQEQLNQSGKYDLYPLSEIQNEHTLGNKLIQTIVAFENYEDATKKEIQVPLFELERIREETNYDLTLSIQEGELFAISILYDTKKYSEQGTTHILNYFCQILNSVANAPQQQISNLDFLSTEQKNQLEQGFNQTKVAFPDEKSVVDLFNEILLIKQEHTALSSERATVSYEELDRLSTNLAYNLKTTGIAKGDIVAVMADRKIETIIFFLGILKAGAAYLPIDVKSPVERTKFILEDANCKVICDSSQNINKQQLMEHHKVITTAAFEDATAKEKLPKMDAEDLAYVIYTSGTTGVPKGVMITHKNIVRLVKNTNYVDFDDSRILQTGSLTFDACTFEIWGALLNGGELFMTTTNVLLDPEELEKVIQTNKINTLFITTALFVNIVELYPKAFSTLRRVLVGGEKIVSAPIKRFKQFNPTVSICNIYGPTENTTFSLFEELDYEIETIVPIGKPISNTTAYVMKEGRLCGIGIPGELYLGGDGLAAGYLNLKEVTDENFVVLEANKRLYKTGDLVRWLENGSIDYLGRIDEQVKIRGFRIELEEITTVIKQLPYVSNAITIIFEDNVQKEICSYVKCDNATDIENVRHELVLKLPHYMVPKVIMNVENFKLNKNGKIDKSAIPTPGEIEKHEFIAARNETESVVCDVFSVILAVDEIGVKDDFFMLGGHSLKVMQLSAKLAAATGIKLSLEEIMTERTVEKIARKLQMGEAYLPIAKGNTLIASSAQNRVLLVEETVTNSTAYNIPVVLMIEGTYSFEKLNHSLKMLSQKYDILRTSFMFKEGNFFQTITDDVSIPISVSKIKKDVLNQGIFDFVQPFDLTEGPLLRGHIFTLSENEHAFVVDLHHAIFDGESIPIFVKELTALYNGEHGHNIKIQYKDYSSWENKLDLEQQEQFWLEKLQGAEFNTEFPTDFVRGSDANFIGNSVTITLPTGLKEKIQAFGKKHGITNYIFYTAIFDLLLSKYTRKEEVIIGTAMSGRNHPDLEYMLGMFVNTVVLKQEMNTALSFIDFVKEVQANFFEVFKKQDYPFEKLVEKLGIQSSRTRNPIFDIMFSYETLEDKEYSLGNAMMKHYELPNTTAKFDLTLTVKEHPEQVLINFDYDFKLFKEDTMKKASEHFVMLLTHALNEPNSLLNELSMIDQAEEGKLRYTFNTQTVAPLQHKTAVSWFEDNVQKYPERVAVGIGDKEVSYAELNKMANGVAKKLKDSGVGRHDVVSLLFNRSIEFIASIYGVLKVGAAYLPIDVELPNKRIDYILANSQTKIILTNAEAYPSNLKTIFISGEDKIDENLPLVNKATDCAYIIYTSGTTGNPKGVEIKHDSLINLIEWQKEQADITDNSVVLQKATCSFDASVWEIFLATLSGIKLQMISEEENQDYSKLLQIIQDKNITHMLMVPTVFDSILDYMKAEGLTAVLDGLEKIYLGAETLTAKLLEKYAQVTTSEQNLTKITNLYGPTEATVCATFHEVSPTDLTDHITIGKPVRNAQVYIMNDGKLSGIDVAGEICIGGSGVFKKYSGSECLTEEKMIPSNIDENRSLYRTGDLGKVDQYGRIHYLGRIDKQVKIRGFRIEIEEIEKQLLELPTISNAAVIINESLGSPQICAYLISDTSLDISKVLVALKDVFPDYMIPAFMKQIAVLPVNHNGKLDEKVLKAIPIEYSTEIILPRTKDETKLLPLFKEVLGNDDIGVTDNFFELGGYSLKAVELSRRIEQEFSLRVSLKDIMKEQSVENIAKIIKKKNKKVFKPLLKAAEECLDE